MQEIYKVNNHPCFLIMSLLASPLFERKYEIDYSPSYENQNTNKWYTSECEEKRRSFYAFLNLYRNEKTDSNRKDMVSKRSGYKKCKRKARFDYDKNETQKISQGEKRKVILENVKRVLWYQEIKHASRFV